MWIHLLSLELIDGAGGSAPPEPVITGGHYGAWWLDKYRKMWERKKPTIEEVIEVIEEQPQASLEVVREQVESKFPAINYQAVRDNLQLQRFVAEQILIVMELKRIQDDEDDIETILMLI